MAEASDTRGILRQNLLDAGCGPAIVQQCMDLAQKGERRGFLRILSHHRQVLLDRVHAEQKQIDCLDFLVYQIEKGNYRSLGGISHGRKTDFDSGVG